MCETADALSAGQVREGADATLGGREEGADGGRMQRLAVSDAQQKLAGTADLLGEGATGLLRRGYWGSEPGCRAPQGEDQRPQQQYHYRGAEPPGESEERRVPLI